MKKITILLLTGVLCLWMAYPAVAAVVLYLLKAKVGQSEAHLCRTGIKQQIEDKHIESQLGRKAIIRQMDIDREWSDTNHQLNKKELRLIRKGLAYSVAKQWGKEEKIKEWTGKDASMIVEAIVDDLNGD